MSVTWPAKDRRNPEARQSRDRLAVWLDVHPADLASVSGSSAAALDSLVHAAWQAATNSPPGRPKADQLMVASRSMDDLAQIDTAIGMAYRRLAQTYLREILDVPKRPGRVTVCLAAIDDLDAVVAEDGHRAAQRLARQVELRLREWADAGVRVERLGEGVFMVIFPGLGERQASKVGDELAAAALGTLGRKRGDGGFTVSIGTASGAGIIDATSVIGAADRALYRASRRGGGRIVSTRLRPPAPPDGQITQRFGQRVRELRNELGISMEELARRSGLHRTYIAGVESGHRHPTLRNIVKLAAGLGRSPADVLESV
jgi:GGDEF domain-containing protein/DNA-binding XRE family transcriptional regulator